MDSDTYAVAFVKAVAIEQVSSYEEMNTILATILTAMRDDEDIGKDDMYALAMNAITNGHLLWEKE